MVKGYVFLDLSHMTSLAEVRDRLAAACTHHTIVHFRHPPFGPNIHAAWQLCVAGLGRILSQNHDGETGIRSGDGWREVPGDTAPNLQRAPIAQHLHTDDAYLPFEHSAEKIALFCQPGIVTGSRITFADGRDIVAALRRDAPELYVALRNTPISFADADRPGKTAPVIIDLGDRIEMCWNAYHIAPGQGVVVDQLVVRFSAYLNALMSDKAVCRSLTLQRNHGVIWWDKGVLHAREGVVAQAANDRMVCKYNVA